MRIYIDESGVFKTEARKNHSISCITALMVPNVLELSLLNAFELWKLHPSLQNKKERNGEIKGSSLDEKEMASFLLLLSRFDVIVETVCVDMGDISDAGVLQYKEKLASQFSRSQTAKKISQRFNKDVLMSLSLPLFVQSYSLYNLISKVLEISISYYVQRFPQELSNFQWIIDAKDKSTTEYEEILAYLVKPFLQWINYNGNKVFILGGEDYSALNKYLIPLKDLLEPSEDNEFSESPIILNINNIMANMLFDKSHDKLGLQIVDILANCIRRSMSGRLQFEGWKYLSNLIVRRKSQAIEILVFNSKRRDLLPYTVFVNYFRSCGKKMLVPGEIKSKIINSTKKGYISWSYLEALHKKHNKRINLEYY